MPGGSKRLYIPIYCTQSMSNFLLTPGMKGLRSIWTNQPKMNKTNKQTKNSTNQ